MPTLILRNRRRRIHRGRPRLNAPGNFVTIRQYATVYSLTFTPTPAHYVKWDRYEHPYPKAWGYIDAPAPIPRLVPLGPIGDFEAVGSIYYPPGTSTEPPAPPTPPVTPPVVYPPTPPVPPVTPPVAAERRPIGPPFLPGIADKLTVGTSPKRIFEGTYPCARVTVLARSANVGTIWVAYSADVAAEHGFPLAAGAARDFEVDDLSKLYFIGTDANDAIYYTVEK